ncbi:MAG: hypothetical protein ACP5IO_01155 [Elusimicrobiales bacterium]
MRILLKLFFSSLWCCGIIFSIYLFKKTISDIYDISELYSYAFFYSVVVIALSLAFLPVVLQSKGE